MGFAAFDPVDYTAGVTKLNQTGQTFARSQTAAATGRFDDIAEILDPLKMKNGMRESCFAVGFADATPIIVSIDGTGSMEQVPFKIQEGLPDLFTLLVEQGVSDHPNIMFMLHDDENVVTNAAFQMSQFETDAPKLLGSLNELIIPHNGGGNQGEAYHLPIYAAANHTRLECFERDQTKGFFFLIGDEEPYYFNGDPTKEGTQPDIAKAVFGDILEKTVTILESLKKLAQRYNVYVIRPGHTGHGKNKAILERWRELFKKAGLDPECVLEIKETEAIIPTIALTVGGVLGGDRDTLVDVLRKKGVLGIDDAANATALVPVTTTLTTVGKATGSLTATGGGRRRR